MDLKTYLTTCSREELTEVLLNVPEVRDYIHSKFNTINIKTLVDKIPSHLITNHFLTVTINNGFTKELKKYIIDHFDGAEIHKLFEYFNFNNNRG